MMWVLSAIAATAVPNGIITGLFILTSVASLGFSGYFLARELGLTDAITQHAALEEPMVAHEAAREEKPDHDTAQPAPVEMTVPSETIKTAWSPLSELPDPVVGYTGIDREFPAPPEEKTLVAEMPFRAILSGGGKRHRRRRRVILTSGPLSWIRNILSRKPL